MSNTRQKILTLLKNNRQYIVMICFVGVLFAKQLMFQWNAYHSMAISSIITDPLYFWSFWVAKIAIVLFVGSFVLIGKRNWWTIIFSVLIDFWMLANMMYLRSNGLLLDGYAFTMTSNMDGFWSSCWGLLEWVDTVPFMLSIALAFLVVWLEQEHTNPRNWKLFVIAMTASLLINWASFTLVRQFECRFYAHGVVKVESVWRSMTFNPFTTTAREGMKPMNKDYAFANFSLTHGVIFDILDFIDIQRGIKHPYRLTPEEQEMVAPLMGIDHEINHERTLLIVLIESLESWAVQPEIMPNLYCFIDTHPVAYVRYSESQIVGGSSADGQMIVNTGLLPVRDGATCFRFPYVTYPSIVDRNDSSVTILTHSANCWNQKVMSNAYGYTQLIEGEWHDEVLSERVIQYAQRGYKTIQAITVTSHIPFEHAGYSNLEAPADMPGLMAKYCKSLHLTDEGLASLFAMIDSIPTLKDATIVITGDHSIFWKDRRDEFKKWCKQHNREWPVEIAACPVIYYSPSITEDIEVLDLCYQMDIFPTLLNLTGNEEYYWKGFGINVLDTNYTKIHRNDIQSLFELSDKVIQANYFECN